MDNKCSYCEKEAEMEVINLKDKITKKFCKQHFGDFVTQGQASVQAQFLAGFRGGGIYGQG